MLSWSGHDIHKLGAVPALLLQRQIVHAEFPGVAPKALLRSCSQTLCGDTHSKDLGPRFCLIPHLSASKI